MQPASGSPALECQKCGGQLNQLQETVEAASGFFSSGEVQVIRTFECCDCGAVFTQVEAAGN